MIKIEKKDKKRYAILLLIIVIALLVSGIRLVFEDPYSAYSSDCMIEYGNGECIGGYLRIPLHNPNQQDIDRIRITVPFGIKTNITLPADFTVNEPLQPGETGILTLFSCEESVDVRGFSVEWCCNGGCYKGKMIWPTSEVFIEAGE